MWQGRKEWQSSRQLWAEELGEASESAAEMNDLCSQTASDKRKNVSTGVAGASFPSAVLAAIPGHLGAWGGVGADGGYFNLLSSLTLNLNRGQLLTFSFLGLGEDGGQKPGDPISDANGSNL